MDKEAFVAALRSTDGAAVPIRSVPDQFQCKSQKSKGDLIEGDNLEGLPVGIPRLYRHTSSDCVFIGLHTPFVANDLFLVDLCHL